MTTIFHWLRLGCLALLGLGWITTLSFGAVVVQNFTKEAVTNGYDMAGAFIQSYDETPRPVWNENQPEMVDEETFFGSKAQINAARGTTELFQNGARYVLPADRTAVNAFNKSALADFRASGGQIVNTKTPQPFNGRYQPETNTIELAPGRHLDTLTEELIHFRQAQGAGIVNKQPFRGGPSMWEADAFDRMLELDFTPLR